MRQPFGIVAVTLATTLLTACGGGGTSSGVPPVTPTPTPAPAPTPTTPTATLNGTVIDRVSGAPLAGFTVTVGSLPNASTCLAAQTAAAMPCGVPATPTLTATTTASGTFTLTIPIGTDMLTIGKDGTYATLHRIVITTAGANALGTAKLTALDATRQAWLADYNNRRATVSIPTSFANQVVDEYAQEQADQWAADVAAGTTPYSDAGYNPYVTAYAANPGAMYIATGVIAVGGTPGDPSSTISDDAGWFGEITNCPNGNWQTCTFSDTTGHYIDVSSTAGVWIGLGYTKNNSVGFQNENPIDVMIIGSGSGTAPATFLRHLAR